MSVVSESLVTSMHVVNLERDMQACSLRAWKQVFGHMEVRELNIDFKMLLLAVSNSNSVFCVYIVFLCYGFRQANK